MQNPLAIQGFFVSASFKSQLLCQIELKGLNQSPLRLTPISLLPLLSCATISTTATVKMWPGRSYRPSRNYNDPSSRRSRHLLRQFYRAHPIRQVSQAEQAVSRNGHKGLGFYPLRHTFRTVADEAMDQPAADFIIGPEIPHMSSVCGDLVCLILSRWLCYCSPLPTWEELTM